jgi:hypothetical protein
MPAIVFASTYIVNASTYIVNAWAYKNKSTLSLTLVLSGSLTLFRFLKSWTVLLLLSSTPIVINQQFEEVVRLH